jgi:hypothetical protein
MAQLRRQVSATPSHSVMRTKRGFEVSVGTHTKGGKLDGYTVRRIDGHEMLLDPDLLKLPVEMTITTGGIFGRGLPNPTDLTRTPAASGHRSAVSRTWGRRHNGCRYPLATDGYGSPSTAAHYVSRCVHSPVDLKAVAEAPLVEGGHRSPSRLSGPGDFSTDPRGDHELHRSSSAQHDCEPLRRSGSVTSAARRPGSR